VIAGLKPAGRLEIDSAVGRTIVRAVIPIDD